MKGFFNLLPCYQNSAQHTQDLLTGGSRVWTTIYGVDGNNGNKYKIYIKYMKNKGNTCYQTVTSRVTQQKQQVTR
jgi:hypothetical protein